MRFLLSAILVFLSGTFFSETKNSSATNSIVSLKFPYRFVAYEEFHSNYTVTGDEPRKLTVSYSGSTYEFQLTNQFLIHMYQDNKLIKEIPMERNIMGVNVFAVPIKIR